MLAAHERHIDDTALATTVRVHGLVLVTRNVRHVLGRGVSLLNPYKRPPERIDP
jgi:toxin FitB